MDLLRRDRLEGIDEKGRRRACIQVVDIIVAIHIGNQVDTALFGRLRVQHPDQICQRRKVCLLNFGGDRPILKIFSVSNCPLRQKCKTKSCPAQQRQP